MPTLTIAAIPEAAEDEIPQEWKEDTRRDFCVACGEPAFVFGSVARDADQWERDGALVLMRCLPCDELASAAKVG